MKPVAHADDSDAYSAADEAVMPRFRCAKDRSAAGRPVSLLHRFVVATVLAVCVAQGGLGCHAGSIVGTVRAIPPRGDAQQNAAGGAYESRRYKYVEKIDYDKLRDFVVYVDQPMSEVAARGAAKETVKTTQKDANFEPHVLPVVVGTAVRWPNEDDIFHNVFSMSDAKEFDLGYYKTEKVPEVRFERIGRVDVFCAIHPKMHCIILVVPNRFFSTVDDKGRFVIRNLPAGTYKVRAWHERIPSQTKEVVVPESGEVNVAFTPGFGELPKY